MSEPRTRLIRVSVELLNQFGTRTEDGRRMTAKWGRPKDSVAYQEAIYEPVFTATDDGKRIVDAARLEKLEAVAAAVQDYSPRYDHDWRCEVRTAEAGWKEGEPPTIDCECGYDALRAALDRLGEDG